MRGLQLKHAAGGVGALLEVVGAEFGLKEDVLLLVERCCEAFQAALRLLNSGVLDGTSEERSGALQGAFCALKDHVRSVCKCVQDQTMTKGAKGVGSFVLAKLDIGFEQDDGGQLDVHSLQQGLTKLISNLALDGTAATSHWVRIAHKRMACADTLTPRIEPHIHRYSWLSCVSLFCSLGFHWARTGRFIGRAGDDNDRQASGSGVCFQCP